ncbi:hypothetical protein V498_04359 [Pseudogymnoascus sp. VKM F-4517 (FW-2822)]|nr:hypothetical protein V498_04359 [Pseudogymnoascus sp. VKM F-4517 (FW-2822)]
MASHTNDNVHYDISELVRSDLREQIPPPVVTEILSSPPFVTIPGAINVRDISSTRTAHNIRQGFAYRSGALTKITGLAMARLVVDVGVKTIFDLRNSLEREKHPSPEIPGAETIWLPYAAAPQKADMDAFGKSDGGVSAFVDMYDDVLKVLRPTFKAVFTHIRDQPQKPFLFHCTTGKDRTGVLAALILQLVGADSDSIAHDYLLTRVGTEPARASLLSSLQAGVKEGKSDPTPASPGMLAIMSVKCAANTTFVESIEARFKEGIIGYLKTDLGFLEEDIEKMRVNLAPLPLKTSHDSVAVGSILESR